MINERDNRKGREKNLRRRCNLSHICEAKFDGHNNVSCFETANGTIFIRNKTGLIARIIISSFPKNGLYSFGTMSKCTLTRDPLYALKWLSCTLMSLFWINMHIFYF